MTILGFSKKDVQNKWSEKMIFICGVMFLLGLILTPILIGFPLLVFGGIGFFLIFLRYGKIGNESLTCPNCKKEIFYFTNEKVVAFDCPVCKQRIFK
jgi:hypothetical protein